MREKIITVNCLGCCLTREIFNVKQGTEFTVKGTVYGQNPLLMFQDFESEFALEESDIEEIINNLGNEPDEIYLKEWLSHNFNRRTLMQMLNGTGYEFLLDRKGDFLVMDGYCFFFNIYELTYPSGHKVYFQSDLSNRVVAVVKYCKKYSSCVIKKYDASVNDQADLGKFKEFINTNWGNNVIIIDARNPEFKMTSDCSLEAVEYRPGNNLQTSHYLSKITQALDGYFISYPSSLITTDKIPVHYFQLIRNYIKEKVDIYIDVALGNLKVEEVSSAMRRVSQIETAYSEGVEMIIACDTIDFETRIKLLSNDLSLGGYKAEMSFKKILGMSKLNDARIDHLVASAYLNGRGTEQNYAKSAYHYRKAISEGSKVSYTGLFDALWKINTPESLKEMIDLALPLAELGNIDMCGRMGRAYRDGKGIEKNIPKAIEMLRLAVSKNVWWSHIELFDILYNHGTDEDYNEMIHLLDMPLEKYDDNNLGSVYGRLGRAYRDGKGVERDLNKAAEWMRKAAERNLDWSRELFDILGIINTPEASKEMIAVANNAIESEKWSLSIQLGRAYYRGKGIEKNIPKAIEMLRLAVSKNVWWSHIELFDILYNHGTDEDYNEMIHLLDMPLEKYDDNNLGSVYGRLGRAYRDGKGVKKDEPLAQSYYEDACKLNILWNNEYISYLEDRFVSVEDNEEKIKLSIKLSEKGIKKYNLFLLRNSLNDPIKTEYKKIIKLSMNSNSTMSEEFKRFVYSIYEDSQSLDPIIELCLELYGEITPADNMNNKRIIECINQLLSILKEIAEKFNINYNPELFFNKLYPLNNDFNAIHRGNRQILSKFDDVCSRNKIQYSLAFGTLLGAYRHENSIPWDDDIDVCVFRKELTKIENALKNDEDLMLVKYIDVTSDTGRFFMAYKVKHRNSPLFLDIFILDYVGGYTRKVWSKFKILEKQFAEDTSLLINEVSRPYIKEDRVNALLEKYLVEVHKQMNFKNIKKRVLWGIENYTMRTEFVFEKKDFLPYRMMKFGEKMYPVPNNTEKILIKIYGDLFKLPFDITSHYHYSDNDIEKIINLDSNQI